MIKMIVGVALALALIFGYSSFFVITDRDSFSREDIGKVVAKNYENASSETTTMMVGKVPMLITNSKPAKYKLNVIFTGYTESFEVSEFLHSKYRVGDEIPVMVYHRERVRGKQVIVSFEIFKLKE